MSTFIDDNGISCFVDDNGITSFVDDNGNELTCGGTTVLLGQACLQWFIAFFGPIVYSIIKWPNLT